MSQKHTCIIAIDAANEYALDEDFTNKYMSDPHRARHLVKVVSVKQMITAVTSKLHGRLLSGLMILGHGRPGVQGVGMSTLAHHADNSGSPKHLEGGSDTYDPVKDTDAIVSLRTDHQGRLRGDGQFLKMLKGKFTAHAMVVLGGCKVGAGHAGDRLLKAISAILGNIRVQAAVQTQYPLKAGCEGPCKEAIHGHVYPVDSSHESKLWKK